MLSTTTGIPLFPEFSNSEENSGSTSVVYPLRAPVTSASNPPYSFADLGSTGIYALPNAAIAFSILGNSIAQFSASNIQLKNNVQVGTVDSPNQLRVHGNLETDTLSTTEFGCTGPASFSELNIQPSTNLDGSGLQTPSVLASTVNTDRLQLIEGVAVPSITGIACTIGKIIHIITNSASRLSISSTLLDAVTLPIRVLSGTLANPGIQLGSASNGLYATTNTVHVVTEGVPRLLVNSGGITTGNVVTCGRVVTGDGTAFPLVPAIQIGSGSNGLYQAANVLNFVAGGGSRFTLSSTLAQFTGSIRTPAGTVTGPAIQIGDSNSGIFRPSAGTLEIVTSGVTRISTTAARTTFNHPILLASGTAAAPSLTFASDSSNNTGFYLAANDDFRTAVNGQDILRFQEGGTTIGVNGSLIRTIVSGSRLITGVNIPQLGIALVHTITVPASTFADIPNVSFTVQPSSPQAWTDSLILSMTGASTATNIEVRAFNPQANTVTGNFMLRWILIG